MRKLQIRPEDASRADANYFIDLYKDSPDVIVTAGYLRFEQSLQNTLTGVQFNILENQGTVNVTEKRLSLPDAFHITKIFIGIMKAGTTTAATQAQIAAATVRTFPNITIFSNATENAALESLYNGNYTIKVGTTTFVDRDSMRKFRRAGTSQQGQGPAQTILMDEFNAPDFGFYSMTPTVRLSGADTNVISVNLPISANTAGTSSQNFIVCEVRGFYVQNGAKFRV